MSANLALTTSEFDAKVASSEQPVLLDFWAEWCGPCKALTPAIEELARDFEGKAGVYKVDVDVERDLAEKFGVTSIPALVVIKGGREVDRMIGLQRKEALAALLNRHL